MTPTQTITFSSLIKTNQSDKDQLRMSLLHGNIYVVLGDAVNQRSLSLSFDDVLDWDATFGGFMGEEDTELVGEFIYLIWPGITSGRRTSRRPCLGRCHCDPSRGKWVDACLVESFIRKMYNSVFNLSTCQINCH